MCIRVANSSCCLSARRTDKGRSSWPMRCQHQPPRAAPVEARVVPHRRLQLQQPVQLQHQRPLSAEEEVEARRPRHRGVSNKRRIPPFAEHPSRLSISAGEIVQAPVSKLDAGDGALRILRPCRITSITSNGKAQQNQLAAGNCS